jgi:hypothetical protein
MSDINGVNTPSPTLARLTSPVTPSARPRYQAPTIPRLSQPRRIKFADIAPTVSKQGGGGDESFGLGDIVSIVPSVLRGVGSVIQAAPTFIGQAAQTALGAGEYVLEGLVDNPFRGTAVSAALGQPEVDVVPFVDYTSRLERDLAKADELGLTGLERLQYATQRQLPLVGQLATSYAEGGKRLAELVPFAGLDYGQPGVDYYNALKSGDLGALLLEDIGNVVLAGRATGLGNVGVRAGGALAEAGLPGAGRIVSGVSRLADEPIGTTARVGARLGAPLARTAGLTRTAESLGRIGAAETPFRQTVTEVRDVRANTARLKINEALTEVARLNDEIVNRQARGATEPELATLRAQVADQERIIADNVSKLPETRQARQQMRQSQIETEAERTNISAEAARLINDGIAPETVETLRQQADALERQADAGNPNAAYLRELAQNRRELADLKETNPEAVSAPVSEQLQIAANIVFNGPLANYIVNAVERGVSFTDLARLLTPPETLTSPAFRGYRATPEAVESVYRYMTGAADALEKASIDRVRLLYSAFSQRFTGQMLAGEGATTGAMPYTYLLNNPEPKFLLTELAKMSDATRTEVLSNLNARMAAILATADEATLEQLGLTPDDLPNAWVKMAEMDYDTPGFQAAYQLLADSFGELRQNFPDVFENPLVYPRNVRPTVFAQRAEIREAQAQDVAMILGGLNDIASRTPSVFPKGLRERLADLTSRADEPGRVYDRAFLDRVRRLLNTASANNSKRIGELTAQFEQLTEAQRIELEDLQRGEQALADITLALEAAEANLAGVPRLRTVEEEVAYAETGTPSARLRTATERERAGYERVAEIDTEIEQVREQIAEERRVALEPLATLQQSLDELIARDAADTKRMDALVKEKEALTEEVAQQQEDVSLYAALSDADKEAVLNDLLIIDEYRGPRKPPTPADVKAWKAAEVKKLQDRVDDEFGQQELLFPDVILWADFRIAGTRADGTPITMSESNITEDLSREDYSSFIARMLLALGKKDVEDWLASKTSYIDANGVARIPSGKYRMEGNRFYPVIKDSDMKAGGPGQQIDQVVQGYEYAKRGDDSLAQYSPEDALNEWLGIITRIAELEKEIRRIKRMTKAEVSERLLEDPETEYYMSQDDRWQSGLTEQQILRMYELEKSPAKRRTLVEKLEANRKKLEELTREEANLDRRRREFNARAPELRRRLEVPVSKELNRRLNDLISERDKLVRGRGRARQSLQFARKAEPRERAKETRARLRGTAEVTSTGEVRLLRGVERRAQARLTRAARAAEGIQGKLDAVREEHALREQAGQGLEEVAGAAEAVSEVRTAPFGPQLTAPGERTGYLPGGLSSTVLATTAPGVELRTPGAAPQIQGAFEQTAETAARPLTLAETANRINQIMNQQARNKIVEDILQNPQVTTNPATLLGEDAMNRIIDQATRMVEADTRTVRTPAEIQRAIKLQIGIMLVDAVDALGYEPVSAVKVNLETGQHAATGDLLGVVEPGVVDGNTFLMRKGLRERIGQEYVSRVSSVPEGVSKALRKAQQATASWKSYILSLSLRWQVGDAVSSILFAWVRGDVTPRQLFAQVRDTFYRVKQEGRRMTDAFEGTINDPALTTLFGAGLQARGQRMAETMALRSGGDPRLGVADFEMRGPMKRFRTRAFKVNEFNNGMFRSSTAMVKLQRLLEQQGRTIYEVTPELYATDPVIRDAVNETVRTTNEALGAFSELTPFEKNVMRQIYPFWSWLKFSNKAAAQLAIDNPDRVLFALALGSLATDPDDNQFFDWLRGKTPVGGFLVDLSFLNPYQDALIFGANPLTEFGETLSGVSPVITTPIRALDTVIYYGSGRSFLPFGSMQRPGYLEGRPGATTRTFGDLLGELGYMGLQTFAPPLRNVLQLGPSGTRIPGTDVALGPVQRYPQGSPRTTGAYAEPRLGPVAGRLSAVGRTFGLPMPLAQVSRVNEQAAEQAQRDRAARLRRIQERQASLK